MEQHFPSKLSVLDPVRAVQGAVQRFRRWLRRSELPNCTRANPPESTLAAATEAETPQTTVDPALATSNPQELPTTTSSSQPSTLSTSTGVSTPSTSADESSACTQLNLEGLYPDQGPMHGGTKILIAGSGFEAEQRLTMHFGPNPPVDAVFKAPNNLLCILPRSVVAGPTPVTLHWSEGTKARASADHCEFTYIDQRDQEICASVLQLYGVLEWGERQAPVEVAKRMIKAIGESIPGSMPTGTSPAHQPVLTILQALLDGNPSPAIKRSIALLPSSNANAHSREEASISILNSHPWSPKDSTTFNLVNEYGQNIAHLCAQLGYHRLLTFVIERGVDIGARDANGWTPLDFARFYGDLNAVDILEGDWECDVKVPEHVPLRLEPQNLISLSRVSSPGVVQTAQSVEQLAEYEPARSYSHPYLTRSFPPPQSPRTDDVSGLGGSPFVDLTSTSPWYCEDASDSDEMEPETNYIRSPVFAGRRAISPSVIQVPSSMPTPLPTSLSSYMPSSMSSLLRNRIPWASTTMPAPLFPAMPAAAVPHPVSATLPATAGLRLKRRRSKVDGEQSIPKGGKHTARSRTWESQFPSITEFLTSREDDTSRPPSVSSSVSSSVGSHSRETSLGVYQPPGDQGYEMSGSFSPFLAMRYGADMAHDDGPANTDDPREPCITPPVPQISHPIPYAVSALAAPAAAQGWYTNPHQTEEGKLQIDHAMINASFRDTKDPLSAERRAVLERILQSMWFQSHELEPKVSGPYDELTRGLGVSGRSIYTCFLKFMTPQEGNGHGSTGSGGKWVCLFGDETHPCPKARWEEAFNKPERAIEHIRNHLGHRPFWCNNECGSNPPCTRKFSANSYRYDHWKKPHKRSRCPVCGEPVQSQYLARHMRTHANEDA